MGEIEKIPITVESLEGFARYIYWDLAGRKNPPAVIDVYSSREGDKEKVQSLHEALARVCEEGEIKGLFETRQKKPPVPRAFLGPASEFYSVNIGHYAESGGIPRNMFIPEGTPLNLKSDSREIEGQRCSPKFVQEEERILANISWGTVIDHIPAGRVMELPRILGIPNTVTISLGDNYPSKILGRKGVLKLEDYELNPEQQNMVAFYAEDSTLSLIRMGRVNRKIEMQIPKRLERVLQCPSNDCDSDLIYHPRKEEYECLKCGTPFGLDKLMFKSFLNFQP